MEQPLWYESYRLCNTGAWIGLAVEVEDGQLVVKASAQIDADFKSYGVTFMGWSRCNERPALSNYEAMLQDLGFKTPFEKL